MPHEVILLVEDQESVRRALALTLARHGYSVLEAHDAQEAVHLIEAGDVTIQLAILDVVLPEPGSAAVATALTQRMHPLRVILMSGYGREWMRQSPVAAVLTHVHGLRFLEKPFALTELSDAVAEILASPDDVVVTGEWKIPQ